MSEPHNNTSRARLFDDTICRAVAAEALAEMDAKAQATLMLKG